MLVNIKGEQGSHSVRLFYMCFVPFQTVVDEETGLPTDRLSEAAITECRLAGSMATTVGEITHGKDDCVSRMIKQGIDEANKHAVARTHKVCTII